MTVASARQRKAYYSKYPVAKEVAWEYSYSLEQTVGKGDNSPSRDVVHKLGMNVHCDRDFLIDTLEDAVGVGTCNCVYPLGDNTCSAAANRLM